jgi:hypothetical protein
VAGSFTPKGLLSLLGENTTVPKDLVMTPQS